MESHNNADGWFQNEGEESNPAQQDKAPILTNTTRCDGSTFLLDYRFILCSFTEFFINIKCNLIGWTELCTYASCDWLHLVT